MNGNQKSKTVVKKGVDGQAGNVGVGPQRGPRAVCHDGAGQHCPPPHPGQLSLPHDGICHPADPGARGGGVAHPWWLHLSLSAR